jgi:hypothetical protein
MSKKYITLELGGKQRGLNFNINTLDFMQSEFDIDPLQFKAESTSWKDLRPYATKIVYVALLSNCKGRKEQPDFEQSDVEVWVGELNGAELTKVVDMWNGQFTVASEPSPNGEVGNSSPVTFQGTN